MTLVHWQAEIAKDAENEAVSLYLSEFERQQEMVKGDVSAAPLTVLLTVSSRRCSMVRPDTFIL